MSEDIETLFDLLIGKVVWHVRRTHGSCFFMEFGNPHQEIREPLPAKEGTSRQNANALWRKRRRISLRGDWSLLVYGCNWSLDAWEYSATNNSDPSDMELPFEALDGQCLVATHYDSSDKIATLLFDLGAKVRLWPYEGAETDETQWSLCSIDGIYWDFLSEGRINIKKGHEK